MCNLFMLHLIAQSISIYISTLCLILTDTDSAPDPAFFVSG